MKKYILILILITPLFQGCPFTGDAPWYMPGSFVAIDIIEDGKCPFPLLVSIKGKISNVEFFYEDNITFLYSNPETGLFGNNEENMDPPLFGTGMVQNCRLYIVSYDEDIESEPDIEIHVKNLQTGKEAHQIINYLENKENTLDYSGCKEKFLSNSDGWKDFVKCGKSLAEVNHFTMELETPTTAFSWQDILEGVDIYTCEQN